MERHSEQMQSLEDEVEGNERNGLLGGMDNEEIVGERRKLLFRLGFSFFIFGLINNVLYVIILSAALDLVPPSTPKGIIAFCNITPSLVAKVGWPYVLKGRVRYRRRLIGCCTLSVLGMLIISSFNSLNMRLLGISFASFACGLGELTFLQLSTTYHPLSVAGHAVGYFASGTGGAGLAGAALWWFIRSLGVRIGIGVSAVLPFIIPISYAFVMPRPPALEAVHLIVDEEAIVSEYRPLPTLEEEQGLESVQPTLAGPTKISSLTLQDKWLLVRPLLMKYMFPLFSVYLLEYTINQGVAPTLIYPVPHPSSFFSHIIKSIRDYYPLWQLVYQSTVFLSRSSLSMGIPPLPAKLLPLPAVVQAIIILTLALDSAKGILEFSDDGWSILCVFLLVSMEGICGGLAYVNTFYHIGQEKGLDSSGTYSERARQEREFKIGSIGFSDSFGILLASILSVPTEVELCKAQVRRGKTLCKEL